MFQISAIHSKSNITNGKATCSYTREAKIEKDINVMSLKLLTKQRHWRKFGAIYTPMTARRLLNISRIRNSDVLYSIQDWRQVASDDFACIYFVTVSVSSVVSTFFVSRQQRKMATRFFFQLDHLAKVVLLWTCLLNTVQDERIFLNATQYVVIVELVFYGPSTHFRSFQAWSVNLATLFLGKSPRQFTST